MLVWVERESLSLSRTHTHEKWKQFIKALDQLYMHTCTVVNRAEAVLQRCVCVDPNSCSQTRRITRLDVLVRSVFLSPVFSSLQVSFFVQFSFVYFFTLSFFVQVRWWLMRTSQAMRINWDFLFVAMELSEIENNHDKNKITLSYSIPYVTIILFLLWLPCYY